MTYVVSEIVHRDDKGKETGRDDLVAYVRTDGEDGTVTLRSGDPLPDDANEAHVAHLLEKGVISEAKPKSRSGDGNNPGS